MRRISVLFVLSRLCWSSISGRLQSLLSLRSPKQASDLVNAKKETLLTYHHQNSTNACFLVAEAVKAFEALAPAANATKRLTRSATGRRKWWRSARSVELSQARKSRDTVSTKDSLKALQDQIRRSAELDATDRILVDSQIASAIQSAARMEVMSVKSYTV